jgi:hypothetical protein
MATPQKVEFPSNPTPSSRKFKSKDRRLMKKAVEGFRVYAGKNPCAGQRSALAYFTFPMVKEFSDKK